MSDEEDSARVRRTAASDAYEAEHMSGGEVLHRDKIVSRLTAAMLFGLGIPSLVAGIGMMIAASGKMPWAVGLIPLAVGALLSFLGATLSVLRTVVTRDEVHVQYGLWGPRVPIEAITECRVVPYEMGKFGGWGIKRSFDGTWAYSIAGYTHAVELAWTEKGKTKRAVVSAQNPQALATSIQRAREEMAASPRLRVAGEEDGRDDAVTGEPIEPEEQEARNFASRGRR